MPIPVVTAVSDAVWESRLVAALEHGDQGVAVVRRCVDLADLLATAAAGHARAALLSADLRRLDRDALTRLAVAGVAVVGLVPPGDEAAERWLRALGVQHVVPSDAGAPAVSAAVTEALAGLEPAEVSVPAQQPGPEAAGTGRVVAVWGPTGAPGRTTVAVGVAAELAAAGRSTLLVDADAYGGVVAQLLGLLEESPGLAAACRLANNGTLDLAGLAELARQLGPALRVLPGISRADRWPELRPAALEVVLSLARSLASTTVVDVGFGLEQDEELSYDTTAPRRNGATLAVLVQADTVLAVGSGDPVGLQRLVRGLVELREVLPGTQPTVVVNRLRATAVPGDAEREVRGALARYAGVEQVWCVPHDVPGVDAAVAAGTTLLEVAPGSPARLALQALAAAVVGDRPPARRRRLLRR